MSSLPAHPGARRVSFDTRAPVHSSEDVLTPDSRSPSLADLKSFQETYSSLKSIRLCGLNGHRCRSALCAQCSPKRARRHRRELMTALGSAQAGTVLLWTSTIASTPGRPLGELWSDIDMLNAYMVSGSWLSRRVDGYVRAVEIERSPGGWHPHTHWILVSRNKMTPTEVADLVKSRGVV